MDGHLPYQDRSNQDKSTGQVSTGQIGTVQVGTVQVRKGQDKVDRSSYFETCQIKSDRLSQVEIKICWARIFFYPKHLDPFFLPTLICTYTILEPNFFGPKFF